MTHVFQTSYHNREFCSMSNLELFDSAVGNFILYALMGYSKKEVHSDQLAAAFTTG